MQENGQLWAWGTSSRGQAGDGSSRRNPTLISSLPPLTGRTVLRIFAGALNSAIVTSDLKTFVFGATSNRQLGLNRTSNVITPTLLPMPNTVFDHGVKFIAMGTAFSVIATQRVHTCFGNLSTSTSACRGNGQCVAQDTCRCFAGFVGDTCDIINCFGVFSNETNVCLRRGVCIGPNSCACSPGQYTGTNCITPICFGVAATSNTVCSARGQCVTPNNCSCNAGNFFNTTADAASPNNVCVSCVAGTFSNTRAFVCTPCAAGIVTTCI